MKTKEQIEQELQKESRILATINELLEASCKKCKQLKGKELKVEVAKNSEILKERNMCSANVKKLQEELKAFNKPKKERPTPMIVECIAKKVVKNPINPNYVMKCINCGQEFRSTRKTALYCSPFCSRQYRSKQNV